MEPPVGSILFAWRVGGSEPVLRLGRQGRCDSVPNL